MTRSEPRRGLLTAVAVAIGLAAGFGVVVLFVDTDADEPTAEAGQVVSEPTVAPSASPASTVASVAPTTLEPVEIDPTTTTTTSTATSTTTTTNAVTTVTTTSVPIGDTTTLDCGTEGHRSALLLAYDDERPEEYEADWQDGLHEWLEFIVGDEWEACERYLTVETQSDTGGGGELVRCVKNDDPGSVQPLGAICVDLDLSGDPSASGSGEGPASDVSAPSSCLAAGASGLVLISSTLSADPGFESLTDNVVDNFVDIFVREDARTESCTDGLKQVLGGRPVRCLYAGNPAIRSNIENVECVKLADASPAGNTPANSTPGGSPE